MTLQQQINDLFAFKPQNELVVSLYVFADLKEKTLEMQRIALKNLINECSQALKERHYDDSERKMAWQSLEKIQTFVQEELTGPHSYRGLAVFSANHFWQVYRLPQPVKDGVFLDRTPYVRPLIAILDEYHRILTAVIARRQATLYEYYMGELSELEKISHEVPGRVRLAGWYGLEERRVQRHIHDHEHRHYKNVAERLFQLFKANRFDYLILGGHEAELPIFENHLHPYLKERIIGHFNAEPEPRTPSINRIIEETQRIEQAFKHEQDIALTRELMDKANSNGLGVVGLEQTLSALMQGSVHTLIVEEGWTSSGHMCPGCGCLCVDRAECPFCGSKTLPVKDVVDEAIAFAADAGVFVRHVTPDSALSLDGHIGALLRFRPADLNAREPNLQEAEQTA